MLDGGWTVQRIPETTIYWFFDPSIRASAETESPPYEKPPSWRSLKAGKNILLTRFLCVIAEEMLKCVEPIPLLHEVYDPAIEGPLTPSLLDKIVERKYYREQGYTKLMVAAFVGDLSLVKQLLKEGQRTEDLDKRGHSVQWWAKRGLGGQLLVSYIKLLHPPRLENAWEITPGIIVIGKNTTLLGEGSFGRGTFHASKSMPKEITFVLSVQGEVSRGLDGCQSVEDGFRV